MVLAHTAERFISLVIVAGLVSGCTIHAGGHSIAGLNVSDKANQPGMCYNHVSPPSDLHYAPVTFQADTDQLALQSKITAYMHRYAHALGCKLEKEYGGTWRFDSAGSDNERYNMSQLQTIFTQVQSPQNKYAYNQYTMTALSSDGQSNQIHIDLHVEYTVPTNSADGTFVARYLTHQRQFK